MIKTIRRHAFRHRSLALVLAVAVSTPAAAEIKGYGYTLPDPNKPTLLNRAGFAGG